MRSFQAPPLTEGASKEMKRAKDWLEKTDLPLYVEVGCGAGFHPLAFVRNHPSARILAFERTTEKYDKAEQRLKNHLNKSTEYKRCLIIHGDATHFWEELFKLGSIDGIYFLYPNPYPKNQHANRRLAHMPFFYYAIETLKPNGKIEFATNEKFYYEELKVALLQNLNVKIYEAGEVPPDIKPRSHFEKKYLERRETCYQILAAKARPSS